MLADTSVRDVDRQKPQDRRQHYERQHRNSKINSRGPAFATLRDPPSTSERRALHGRLMDARDIRSLSSSGLSKSAELFCYVAALACIQAAKFSYLVRPTTMEERR